MIIKSAKKYSLLVVAAIVAVAGVSDRLQPLFALTNAGSITALGASLTENFDSLASTGSAIAWSDNTTMRLQIPSMRANQNSPSATRPAR